MKTEQIKAEAQRIFNKHFFNDVDLAKTHALLEVQSNIDLLEDLRMEFKESNVQHKADYFLYVKLNNLKAIKQETEKL
jgi:hypothetical protein